MGMGSFSENCGHQAAVLAAESVRQTAMVPGVTQAAAAAADIAFYLAVVASAKANDVNATQYITALKELGTGGV